MAFRKKEGAKKAPPPLINIANAAPAAAPVMAAQNAPVITLQNTPDVANDITVMVTPAKKPYVMTASATHIGTREYQQDAAYVCETLWEPGLAFAILCDGMGGTAEGGRAAAETVAFMANAIATRDTDAAIPAFLEQMARAANELILEENYRTRQDSGTTLLSVIMDGADLYWLNVGDSRIYIVRDSEIVQVTTDHNFALELKERVERGQITQAEADTDPEKEFLISYIGAPVLERVEVNQAPFKMRFGDIVLLSSDGLTKSLCPDEILEIIEKNSGNIDEAARVLPLCALDESPAALDNTTVVLMQYLGDTL